MNRYSKIERRMWSDAKFRALTRPQPNGQSVWIFLITGEHITSIPGLWRLGEAQAAETLGWPIEGFREAFAEAFAKGLVEADWGSRVIWVPGRMKVDRPESPNVVKSWRHSWHEIPECELKVKGYEQLKAFTEALGEAFAKAFQEGCPKPSPIPHPQPDPHPHPQPHEIARSASGGGVAVAPSGSKRAAKVTKPKKPKPTELAWSQDACEIRKRCFGAVNGGKTCGALAPVVKEYGWDVIRPGWVTFCERYGGAADSQYGTPAAFVDSLSTWVPALQRRLPAVSRSNPPGRKTHKELCAEALDGLPE